MSPFHDPDKRALVSSDGPVMDHFLTRAKAYAALVGSLLTVVVTQMPDNPDVQKWGGLLMGLATAVATFTIPNKPKGV